MSKTEERLKAYNLQMSIYMQQHQMLLASDVLDMIEQLQDDLQDDTDKLAEQLEYYLFEKYCVEGDTKIEEIVKGGGVDV